MLLHKRLLNTPSSVSSNNGLKVEVCLPGDKQRLELESFVAQVFEKHYQTDIKSFYPELLSISTPNNRLSAVAGLRNGQDHQFFSENYLSFPLESYFKRHFGCHFNRNQIVEVGNLAPANIGQMRWLVTALNGYLYGAGYKFVICTAIKPVFNAFKRMGLETISLGAAKRDSLSEKLKQQWTEQYYKLKPYVYVGDVSLGVKNILQIIEMEHPTLIPLWNIAYEQGLKHRIDATQSDIKG